MKLKRKNPAYTLSFLDVLSNAMAAVLIITMVRMKPNPAGDFPDGLYSIHVEHLRQRDNQNLGLAIKLQDGRFLHDPEEMAGQDFRLVKYNHNAVKLLFFGEPDYREIEEIICYVTDPLPIGVERVRITVKMPDREQVQTENLDSNNEFRKVIYASDDAL